MKLQLLLTTFAVILNTIEASGPVTAKKFVLKKPYKGFPEESDVEIITEELPPLREGEFLARAAYLSVDPYMRLAASKLPVGGVLVGEQVAKVVESHAQNVPVGKLVLGRFGWRSYKIVNASSEQFTILPDFGDLPASLGLGILGMPGCTAYLGLLHVGQPKAGETVAVTAAAGAVGSTVGQIAKIKGCKVIGLAGSDEKGKWLVEELGYDGFINYKTADVDKELSKLAPQGIDVYYDNVGGELSSIIMNHMNTYGRVAVCGAISSYNNPEAKASVVQVPVLMHQLKMEGFTSRRFKSRQEECISDNLKWIKEGKLKYRETITEGFDNTFKAFLSMLKGGNTGKAIVKA